MHTFKSIEIIDRGILYVLHFIASISVLFLVAVMTTSVANVLTAGHVISNSEVGKQFYAWSQAIGIDSSIPGVIMALYGYYTQKNWGRVAVYTVLTALALFTAYNVSTVESIAQTLNISLDTAYTSGSLVSVVTLVQIRMITVLLLIVAHALKYVQDKEPVQTVQPKPKTIKPIVVVPVVKSVQEERTPTPITVKKEQRSDTKYFEPIKAFLATKPNASLREIKAAVGCSVTTAGKWRDVIQGKAS